MKNLSFIILFICTFKIFSQTTKLNHKEEMVSMIEKTNYNILKSFNVDSSSIETIKLINNYRKYNGLNELSIDSSLMNYAKLYSEVLATSNSINHSDIGSSNIVSENLYMETGFGMFLLTYDQLSKLPSNTVKTWKDSDAHNKNMLTKNVTSIGIGTYIKKNGGYRINVVMVVF